MSRTSSPAADSPMPLVAPVSPIVGTSRTASAGGGNRWCGGPSGAREGDPDAQDRLARAGPDGDVPAVPVDDAPGDVEAQARTLSDALGREEGVEGVFLRLGGHPGAGVGNLDD